MITRRTLRESSESVRVRVTSHSHATTPQVELSMQLVIESSSHHVSELSCSSRALDPKTANIANIGGDYRDRLRDLRLVEQNYTAYLAGYTTLTMSFE